MATSTAPTNDVKAPLLEGSSATDGSRLRSEIEEIPDGEKTMKDILNGSMDAITYIETRGVEKLGQMKIDDYVAIRAFQDSNLLTTAEDQHDIEWKDVWSRKLEIHQQKGAMAETDWHDEVTVEAYVVNIRNAAGPPGVGILQPLLLRWQSRACPLTVFGLPAVQAILTYKWEAWAARFLKYEFILYLCWLISYTTFIVLFQHEDLDWSYSKVWHHSSIGKAKIMLNLLSVVFMSPFLLIEANTMLDYGFNWFTMWNALDIVTYSIQVITCIVYISREQITKQWFSVLLAIQCIFLFAKVQYFSRVFASAKSSLVDTLKVVISDVKWFLLFILLTMFSFALAFHILFRNNEKVDEFAEIWHAVVTMFSFMLGGFDTEIFYETDDPKPVVAVLFFVAYEAVMAIMLLNLLIAIMTDSYSKVMEDEHLWNLCSKAQIIDELETTMPAWLIGRWNPPYIHILRRGPKNDVDLNSLWSRLDLTETQLKSSSTEMVMKMQTMERRIMDRLEYLAAEIKVLDEFEQNNKSPDVKSRPLKSKTFMRSVEEGRSE